MPAVAGTHDGAWSGRWATDHLDLELRTVASPVGLRLEDLLGVAVRRNPRRAQLLVSRVLGKHVPTDPRIVRSSGLLLGRLVGLRLIDGADGGSASGDADASPADGLRRAGALLRDALAGVPGAAADLSVAVRPAHASPGGVRPLVVSYAETATALGQCVADDLGGDHLHSTRRPVEGFATSAGFEEEHSHATSHLLLPADPDLLRHPGTVVLVDDELSTGRTARNTITALHAVRRRDHYVVAALVDVRDDAARAAMAAHAEALGTRIDVVSLVEGRVVAGPETLDRALVLSERLTREDPAEATGPAARAAVPTARPRLRRVALAWPADVPETGRHGVTADDAAALDVALPGLTVRLAESLRPTARHVLVLGTEELMYAPLRLAEGLAERCAATVLFSSTTRSPVLAVDDAGYAIRNSITFAAHDDPADGHGPRFAHNVAPGPAGQRFDVVVVVTDSAGDTPALTGPDGLVTRLAAATDDVVLVVLPHTPPPGRRLLSRPLPSAQTQVPPPPAPLPLPLHGPAFGSYAAEEVSWLLTDLSHVELEAPLEDREEAIQAGEAHYAESLPIEYQPTADYHRLFEEALAETATRLAHAVGVVTELVLAARGPDAVLVSLARAGTPVGILMRRWAEQQHGLRLPHYAVSIVRGRGIDDVALRYLAAHHDPSTVMFVDGWTGKGAIARELTAAVEQYAARTGEPFSPDLAVLADPGRCVRLFGTRDDFLIPSACLNSTVSGLVSRTVLNRSLIGPGDFHGAKFYAELAAADVSAQFVDTVAERFPDVRQAVSRDWPVLAASDREPTWSGWSAVARLGARHGIDDLNLIKPGVGETTRVLLRRVPWKVLVDPAADVDLSHVLLLARERGVPVIEEPDLLYSCVGLIRPGFVREPGSDGTTRSTSAEAR